VILFQGFRKLKTVTALAMVFGGSGCATKLAAADQHEDRVSPSTVDVSPTPVKEDIVQRCTTRTMSASWAEYYRSMSELKRNSGIGVVGTGATVGETVQPDIGPLFQLVTISVDQLIWNRDGKADVPKSITFEQTGGVAAGSKFELEGDPLFSVGEQAIIFFTEFSPGKYRVTGGPTGRFGFQNGRISPVTDDGIKVAEGTTVEQLLQL